jgi:selenium metabolism protein YedF
MNEAHLDCRSLPCPQPVLECKKTVSDEHPHRIVVTVDNEAASQNVSRFLSSQGYALISEDRRNGLVIVTAEADGDRNSTEEDPGEAASDAWHQASPSPQAAPDRQLVLITSDVIGHGDDLLGGKLMQNFLATLPEMGESLWRIIFINAGVKLTVQGSPVLEGLQSLESAGVSILVCGTCLDHFQLLEHKRVGRTTNMLDVVTSLQLAGKVIHV